MATKVKHKVEIHKERRLNDLHERFEKHDRKVIHHDRENLINTCEDIIAELRTDELVEYREHQLHGFEAQAKKLGWLLKTEVNPDRARRIVEVLRVARLGTAALGDRSEEATRYVDGTIANGLASVFPKVSSAVAEEILDILTDIEFPHKEIFREEAANGLKNSFLQRTDDVEIAMRATERLHKLNFLDAALSGTKNRNEKVKAGVVAYFSEVLDDKRTKESTITTIRNAINNEADK